MPATRLWQPPSCLQGLATVATLLRVQVCAPPPPPAPHGVFIPRLAQRSHPTVCGTMMSVRCAIVVVVLGHLRLAGIAPRRPAAPRPRCLGGVLRRPIPRANPKQTACGPAHPWACDTDSNRPSRARLPPAVAAHGCLWLGHIHHQNQTALLGVSRAARLIWRRGGLVHPAARSCSTADPKASCLPGIACPFAL